MEHVCSPGGGGGGSACFKCGEEGHMSRECPSGGGGRSGGSGEYSYSPTADGCLDACVITSLVHQYTVNRARLYMKSVLGFLSNEKTDACVVD